MLGDKALGLDQLTQQMNTSGASDITLDFKFSGATEHAFTNMQVIVTNCEISFDAKLPVVGVALQMKSMLKTNYGLSGNLA